MLAPMSHGFLLFIRDVGAFVEQMLAVCHSAHLFPSVFLGCLTSVSVQTQVALVIRALDCDHAQPRTGHQIWSQASQVKSKSKAVQRGYSILCLDAENAYFHAEETEKSAGWPPKGWGKRYHARGGRAEKPWWKMKKQLYGRRKAAKKFNEFVVSATVGLGLEHVLSSHRSSGDQERR